jgi:putative MFS transporter
VTCVIPLGVGLGAVLGAFMGSDQWRLLFAIGVLPSLLVLLVRLWVPESPRWLRRARITRLGAADGAIGPPDAHRG